MKLPGMLKKLSSLSVSSLSVFLVALGAASAHAQTVGYVVNQVANTVTAVDTSTNAIVATIPIGNLPARVIAAPNGARAYVTNQGPGTISVINTASNTVAATIIVGGAIAPLAITPDSATLYVGDVTGNTVTVIDAATNAVTGAPIAVAGTPFAFAMTSDGAHLYVAQSSANTVSIIDTATNALVGSPIALGARPLNLAITPDGTRVYAACQGSVVVIDTATNTAVASIPTGILNFGLAITPDGTTVYVADVISGKVSVIDVATNSVVGSITVGSQPETIAITPDGAFAYVPSLSAGTASVIDTSTNTIVGSPVPVGIHPVNMTIFNPTAPFAAFAVTNLEINKQNIHQQAQFTLGAASPAVDLAQQSLTLTIGTFSLTIPAGSFKQVGGNLHFVFNGTVQGLKVNFNLKADHGSSTQFSYVVDIHGTDQTSQPNPVVVTLQIGENTGTTSVAFD